LLKDRTGELNGFEMVQLAFLRRIPKYYKMSERPPGGAGAVLNDSIMSKYFCGRGEYRRQPEPNIRTR
jgi:hypothetical protein